MRVAHCHWVHWVATQQKFRSTVYGNASGNYNDTCLGQFKVITFGPEDLRGPRQFPFSHPSTLHVTISYDTLGSKCTHSPSSNNWYDSPSSKQTILDHFYCIRTSMLLLCMVTSNECIIKTYQTISKKNISFPKYVRPDSFKNHVSYVKIALHRQNPYIWHLSVVSNYILEIQHLSLINTSTKEMQISASSSISFRTDERVLKRSTLYSVSGK
jgi:hypothetical protein